MARISHICEKLCQGMRPLSTTQDKPTPNKSPASASQSGEPPAVFPHHDGFYHEPPNIRQVQLYHGRGRPWIYEGGNFGIMLEDNYGRTDGHHTTQLALQMFWPSRQGNIRQRTTVCLSRI